MLGEGRWDMKHPTISTLQMELMHNKLNQKRGYASILDGTEGEKKLAAFWNNETEERLTQLRILIQDVNKAVEELNLFLVMNGIS